ncbi:MAG: FmdB family transcriptional regulator [Anaerolineaceae bacterium]|nr:MAG: FmdB family transcriptional regulator [Anaerolineaceae bacterium]
MPVYIYRCSSCGKHFEKHQSFDDAPLKVCPTCKKRALKKVITPSKIIFKGSGFYATDNKSASGDSSAGKSHSHTEEKTNEKPASAGKGDKKSKSKSEPKNE